MNASPARGNRALQGNLYAPGIAFWIVLAGAIVLAMFPADWLNRGALLGSLILPAALWVAGRQA